MSKRRDWLKGCVLIMAMSLFLTGCGDKTNDNGQNPESSTEVQSEVQESVSTEVQSEVQESVSGEVESESQSEEPETVSKEAQSETQEKAEQVVQDGEEYVPRVNVNPNARKEWKVAKMSGSLDAFEDYFDLDMKDYTRACDKAGKVEEITYYSEAWKADRSAQVYTPYGYDVSKEYPVIYLIHGIGCDSTQWVSMGAQNMFDHMIAKGEIEPFVAVFPSVIPTDGIDKNTLSDKNVQAFTTFVEEFKTDLHPYLVKYYHVSEDREDTAICGLSMGGMEALRVGFTYLDTFNFIGSFSAAPSLDTKLLTTKDSDYVPELVLVCSGDKDSTVGDNPFNYHMEMCKKQVDHIWYVHPGQGHSPSVWNLGLFNFLKRLTGEFLPK